MFRDWSIKSKLFLGFSIILLMFLLSGIYAINSLTVIKIKSREVEIQDFSAQDLTNQMKEAVLKVSHYLAHTITTKNNREYLDGLDIQNEKFLILASELSKMVTKEPELNSELQKAIVDFNALMKFGLDASKNPYEDNPANEKIHALGESLFKEIGSLQQEYVARLSQSLGAIDSLAGRLRRIKVLLILISLFFGSGLAFYLIKSITGPINKLLEGTKRISKGDFSSPVAYSSLDELGHLAYSFNWMAHNLKINMDEIKQAAGRWQATFDSIRDWILLVDKDCKIIQVNKSFLDYFKMTPERAIGKTSCEFIHKTKHTLPGCPLMKSCSSNTVEKIEMFEPTMEKYLEISSCPIFNEKGEVIRSVHIFEDITARKNSEEELEVAYNQLRTAQTQLIQSAKMEMIGRLASGIAHEVKNPLAIILMGLEYLSVKVPTDTEEVRYTLLNMRDAVRRADYIVKGLLDFSKLSELDLKPYNVNALVEQSLALVKHELDKKHLQAIKDLQEDMPYIDIDKNKIEQVLVNVFMNAVQAMPEGGTLTVRTCMKKLTDVEVGVGRRKEDLFNLDEKAVLIEVEDTGTGIPVEILDKIFEPFFTTKRDIGGTGLGLSVVKNIIEMHRGRITIVNKKEGNGAKCTILFKVPQENV